MNKVIFFLEKMWMVVAIVCFAMAIYKAINIGLGDGLFFLLFGAMATLLWYLRRRTRIQMQGQNQSDQEGS